MRMKNYSKVKAAQKLGFRTPDHFKGAVASELWRPKGATFGGQKMTRATAPRFNPAQFKTQHKG